MTKLYKQKLPSEILIRGVSINVARYEFGDASKAGFGASWESKEGIKYRLGLWSKEEVDNSSGWRGFQNLVDTLKEEARSGGLRGVEVFLFTDISTAEGAFFNGSSSLRGCSSWCWSYVN